MNGKEIPNSSIDHQRLLVISHLLPRIYMLLIGKSVPGRWRIFFLFVFWEPREKHKNRYLSVSGYYFSRGPLRIMNGNLSGGLVGRFVVGWMVGWRPQTAADDSPLLIGLKLSSGTERRRHHPIRSNKKPIESNEPSGWLIKSPPRDVVSLNKSVTYIGCLIPVIPIKLM